MLVCGCAEQEAISESSQPAIETTTAVETVAETTVTQAGTEPDRSDRTVYLPVTVRGEEKNLYDLMEKDSLLYLKRETCEDCIRDGEMVLKTLDELGMPYLVIEVDKTCNTDDIWLESKTAKEIGIKEIPSVCFIRDGQFISHIDNAFTDGSEILEKAAQVYD